MHPQLVSRDALLDDPRFWCLLYEQWLKPRVDDVFAEGEDYFFLTPEDSVGELFHELEAIAVNEGRFPAVSVLVDLANGWRAGVELMMCPEDFEVDYVVVPPLSGEHKIIGVYGGNHWLPAFALGGTAPSCSRKPADDSHVQRKGGSPFLSPLFSG